MSALRIIVAVALVAVAVSAVDTFQGCPAAPTSASFFGNASTKCTKGDACQRTYCACIGANMTANWTCTKPTTAPNCTTGATCLAAKIGCINIAADDAACTELKDLKMSNLAVAGGQLYNASSAYKACLHEACLALNSTAGNCTLNYGILCASPVNFIGTLKLTGDFSKIFANNDLLEKFKAALAKDLANALGIANVIIIRIYIATKSRRQAAQTLIVEFKAEGVSIQNPALAARLNNLKDGNWLVAALAEYKAVYGANATFSFGGIAAGGAGSAKFSASKAGSKTTSTSGTTTGTSAASSSSTSGAATQSLVAAVVVAVIGAMLF